MCGGRQGCTGRRGRRPLQTSRKIAVIARRLGGIKTPPYGTEWKEGGVGANSVRPWSLAAAQDSAGEQCSPLQPPIRLDVGGGVLDAPFWPRRGQTVGRGKSVKKNAALLHFLAFSSNDLLFGVLRGERLAAHNERRQFAAQTRSCGYSPRWGEHCSLPSFATLNCGPLLATPQAPKPGLPRYRK